MMRDAIPAVVAATVATATTTTAAVVAVTMAAAAAATVMTAGTGAGVVAEVVVVVVIGFVDLHYVLHERGMHRGVIVVVELAFLHEARSAATATLRVVAHRRAD